MKAAIGLGSNIGDRLAHLRRAVALILERVPEARLTGVASVYMTDPVDCPPESEAFYNSVIEIECQMEPRALLRVLRGIEAEMGRANEHGWHEPRTIDLDLLYGGEIILRDVELDLPHPRIAQRGFVLMPLAEIRAELVLPGFAENVAALLEKLPAAERAPHCVARSWL